MDDNLCKLTLVCPTTGADRITELMLTFDPPVKGFTTWLAEGHGFGFANASINERVRGSVRRQVIVAVIERQTARALLNAIETTAPLQQLTYWIEPVESFGRMQWAETSAKESTAMPSAPHA